MIFKAWWWRVSRRTSQFQHKYFKQVQTLLSNNQGENNGIIENLDNLSSYTGINFFCRIIYWSWKFHTFPHALDKQLRCLYWKGFPYCHPKCLCLALSVMGSGNSLLLLWCAIFSHRNSVLLSSLDHAAPGNVHSNANSKEKLEEQSLPI